MTANDILKTLRSLSSQKNKEKAERFFKGKEGEYGYGDVFIGVKVPDIRLTVKQYKDIHLSVVVDCLTSEIHEMRLFALLVLVEQFKSQQNKRKEIVTLYLSHTEFINNWDLVDSSCYNILGPYLLNNDRSILFILAESASIWERRIAMVTTYCFIKKMDFDTTFLLADVLKRDKEDLIHKAVGWMLKEVSKRDKGLVRAFLITRYKVMPRIMLRCAIEKFDEEERQSFLKGFVSVR